MDYPNQGLTAYPLLRLSVESAPSQGGRVFQQAVNEQLEAAWPGLVNQRGVSPQALALENRKKFRVLDALGAIEVRLLPNSKGKPQLSIENLVNGRQVTLTQLPSGQLMVALNNNDSPTQHDSMASAVRQLKRKLNQSLFEPLRSD